jgi:hypothetical protein
MPQARMTERGAPTWRSRALALGFAACLAVAALVLTPGSPAQAASYPTMAPVAAYLTADRNAEIALARSAAPPSVSADAEVMVLGPHGYVSTGPGKNGFVCIVERSWFDGVADDGFWNPRLRAPVCFNRQAARSVLPVLLTRTAWAMAGASQAQIAARTRAAMRAGRIPKPESGAFTYMMSKDGYLGDDAGGPWRPHVMFFMPPGPLSDWGANLPGTRVFGTAAGPDPYTMIYVPVAAWSDGTPDASGDAHHEM